MVSMQRGDILIGNDGQRAGSYAGVNIEVWRGGSFVGLLEPSINYGWIFDPLEHGAATQNIGVDLDGSVYCGAASSNSSNAGPIVYKWNSQGDWVGSTAIPITEGPTEYSAWGEDIGRVCTDGPCPPGAGFFVGAGIRVQIVLVDKLGFIYILRRSHVEGTSLVVQGSISIPVVPTLAKYTPAGAIVERYTAALEWSSTVGAGTSTTTNVDVNCGDISCDGRYFIVGTRLDHLLGPARQAAQILKYDLTNPELPATILFEHINFAGGEFILPTFSNQSLSIRPQTNEIISLYGGSGPILRIPMDGSKVEKVHLTGVPSNLVSLEYSLDSRRAIVASLGGEVFLVDLTKPSHLSDFDLEWQAKSVEHLFTSTTGWGNVLGVYNPKSCIRSGGSMFGTVIGAT